MVNIFNDPAGKMRYQFPNNMILIEACGSIPKREIVSLEVPYQEIEDFRNLSKPRKD